MLSDRIYADHAATTPVRPEVLDAMLPYFADHGFNASSQHAEGRRARAALDDARAQIAQIVHARPSEIVFTGGGSESDNLAIYGVTRARRHEGRHIVTTAIEHHAVLHAAGDRCEDGFELTLVEVNQDGVVCGDDFNAALREDTILASVMMVNNEIGTIQPIAQLAIMAHAKGAVFHTDAVQAAAYLPLDVQRLGVDLLSISAHKFYGPKGIGALYVRDGTPLAPLLHGGSQEFAKRAGTQNVAGAVGMAKAFALADAERKETSARVAALRDRFEVRLLERLEDIRINGRGVERVANNSNISFAGVPAELLVMRLDLEGVAASTGSACAAGALEASHVIAALGLDERWSLGALRFSFGRSTTADQIERLAAVVERVVTELRAFSTPPA